MSQVPAATRTLRVLRYLAAQPEPVPLDRLARAVGLPRSTAYHLVDAMVAEGFVTHLADEHRYGLGVAAFEVGSGYARQEPLQRLARRPLAALVDATGHSAHLALLHGRDVLYVLEERAPGRPPLVTDVGVRLPAHLTASGRAILAALPANQLRALYPDKDAFVLRHGVGPASPSALRALLVETRQRGHAAEDGEITPGFASVAAAVLDHNGHPTAGVAVTYPSGPSGPSAPSDPAPDPAEVELIAGHTRRTAHLLTTRLGGGSPTGSARPTPRR
ncbi:IclR family transcriptional regulator [Nocardioides mesophilus]|uniref:Glycerol operon regulatory protein n=1 Tax=Nocardioides mesophilus TaxID=433659 RepID=A0A7G9RF52_9ACTN|nr:IclR family transcriptional regulator [Nocardioides mesophilus]QNN54227.1 IclR family transcriptional regulator [Nocardioides mesophilus]